MTNDVFGWAASAVLVLTLSKQVHAQWKAGTSDGVSPWLFVGELVASVLFLTYSTLISNWVYVVTNVLTALATIAGFVVFWRQRGRAHAGASGAQAAR